MEKKAKLTYEEREEKIRNIISGLIELGLVAPDDTKTKLLFDNAFLRDKEKDVILNVD